MSSDYVACVYDNNGAGFYAVMEVDAPAGATCDSAVCWSETPDAYGYRDRNKEQGPLASLKISAGEPGRAKFKLKANGESLTMPYLPLAKTPLAKAQLINRETNACWEADFPSADSNTTNQFKARSD